MTAVEWLVEEMINKGFFDANKSLTFTNLDHLQNQAKEMEQTNTDNKVIHFAEWLTKKHTSILITLYEQFEEEHYGDK